MHVLRYIFGNPDKALIFHAAPAHQRSTSLRGVFIMGSSDSAHRFAGSSAKPRDQISTFFKLGSPCNAAVHVSSKVSATPTLSACEAENSGAVAVTKEVLDTYLVLTGLDFEILVR